MNPSLSFWPSSEKFPHRQRCSRNKMFNKPINTTVIVSYQFIVNILTLLCILVSVFCIETTDAQIHSSVTISPPVPSHSSYSSRSLPNTPSECSSLALNTCHDVQPVSSGSYVRSLSASSSLTQREVGGYKCEDLNFCDDILGFEAILNLHRQLDDDADGDIDVSESKEFLRDELKYEHGANDRQRAFHGNDKHINVAELWHTWKVSEVHNWTVEEVAQWLVGSVELPQYKDRFHMYSINGMALPRLAVNQHLASNILGISNVIHRQKLALKATDVVLFGVPKPGTVVKDLVMLGLVLFAVLVGYFAIRQNKQAQDHIRKMNREIEALSSAEKMLETMQGELNRTKQEHETAYREKEHLQEKLKEHEQSMEKSSTSSGNGYGSGDLRRMSVQDDQRVYELEQKVRQAMEEVRRLELAQRNKQWAPPRQVKELLQITYEIEIKNYNAKKLRAEAQLREAREECDKLRKKRSSVFGAFRVAHGSSIDIVDATILQARTIMTELTKETHERIQRWKGLEQLCGFDITTNPGLTSLERSLDTSYTSSQSTFMLPHNQSSSTLRDSDTGEFSVAGNLVRRSSIPEEEDGGITMYATPQGNPQFDPVTGYRVISHLQYPDDNASAIRSQTVGVIGQRMEYIQRYNGTGSDHHERHFDSMTSVSTPEMSNLLTKNINCSFESEDTPPSSSSSDSNATPTIASGQSSSLSSTSMSKLKERKSRTFFGLVKKRSKSEKKVVD